MRHKAYNDYFRLLAAENARIRDNAAEVKRNFFRLILSGSPFQKLYIEEFLNAQKSKIDSSRQIMLCETYDADYRDNSADDVKKMMQGAVIILQLAKKENFDAQEVAIDETELTCEQIMARMKLDYEDSCQVVLGETWGTEKIGPVGDGPYFGTKLYFEFQNDGNVAYDEAEWVEEYDFCSLALSKLSDAERNCYRVRIFNDTFEIFVNPGGEYEVQQGIFLGPDAPDPNVYPQWIELLV
jgi:hypothetical protein